MARQKRQTYTYGDLARVPKGTIMVCTGECAGEWSATRGDYFMMPDDKQIYCCGRPVRLVTRSTTYAEVVLS